MQNRKPKASEEPNVSMSEEEKQKTVANPSPGSSDPGNENNQKGRDSKQKSDGR